MGIVQVLPPWHPDHLTARDVIRRARLSEKLRKIAVAGSSIEVVAEVAADLSARIRESVGKLSGFGIQQDPCALNAGGRHYHGLPINFHLLLVTALDVGNAFGAPIPIH